MIVLQTTKPTHNMPSASIRRRLSRSRSLYRRRRRTNTKRTHTRQRRGHCRTASRRRTLRGGTEDYLGNMDDEKAMEWIQKSHTRTLLGGYKLGHDRDKKLIAAVEKFKFFAFQVKNVQCPDFQKIINTFDHIMSNKQTFVEVCGPDTIEQLEKHIKNVREIKLTN